jgi:hypothetical protein
MTSTSRCATPTRYPVHHSAATHLGDKGVPLQLIMAKTRHRNPRTAMRYIHPSAHTVAQITEELLDLGRHPGPRHS